MHIEYNKLYAWEIGGYGSIEGPMAIGPIRADFYLICTKTYTCIYKFKRFFFFTTCNFTRIIKRNTLGFLKPKINIK